MDGCKELFKKLNIYQVALLNLRRRPDKLSFMKLKLKHVSIDDYRVFEAIDGSARHNLKIYQKYCTHCKTERRIIQSPAAMGIAMSYKQMFGAYLQDKNFKEGDKVLILEDDINFHNNFNTQLQQYVDLIKTSDIVYVGANQSRWLQYDTDTHYKVFREKWHSVYGFFGLMMNRKCMRLLYNELDQNPVHYRYTVDYLAWLLIVKHNLNANVLMPNLVIPDVTDSDNMGPRNMEEFAVKRRWDLAQYKTVHENGTFYQHYRDVYSLKIGLESIDDPWFDTEYKRAVVDNNTEFVFIIPSFNNEKWIKNNLHSIMKQQYPFWRVIYIDDASTDNTASMFHAIIGASKHSNRFKYLKNGTNKKQAFSRYRGYHDKTCMNEEVAILLDGDDWLYDEHVLTHLNRLYKDNDIVMTWGQFYYHGKNNNRLSGFGTYPADIDNYRLYPRMVCQHLRTAKIKLLRSIPKQYLTDDRNNWYECCTDVAENMCLLELADKKFRNAQKPLCVYNAVNSMLYPNSYYNTEQFKEKKQIRQAIMEKIKREKPLKPLRM